MSSWTWHCWEYQEDESDGFDVAEGAKVEFEVVDHANLTLLAVFEDKGTGICMGVYVFALRIRRALSDVGPSFLQTERLRRGFRRGWAFSPAHGRHPLRRNHGP